MSLAARLLAPLALGSALLACVLCTLPVGAAPQPNAIPTRWEFDFEPGPLRIAHIRTQDGRVEKYFFLTYKVTNFWDTDLLFAPDARLVTDEGDIFRAGRSVPSTVTEEILRRLDNPLIEDQVSIVGNVLQGPANAREGLLVWPAEDLQTDSVRIFFAGLSGETSAYVTGRGTDDPKRFVLRKTLMLRYDTPGVLGAVDNEQMSLADDTWVMR